MNCDCQSEVTLEGMLGLMRKLRDEHPPSTIAVRVTAGRDVMRELRKVAIQGVSPMTMPPSFLNSIQIVESDVLPPNFYQTTYADGHSEMTTPAGTFQMGVGL